MTEQNEPSMEAILASIRNILAEDEEDISENSSERIEMPPEPEARPDNKPAASDNAPAFSEALEEPMAAAPVDETKEDVSFAPVQDSEPMEEVLDLTAEMIVDEPQQVSEPENMNADNFVPEQDEIEEDDFTPEPVIPQEPMKEETLTDLIKETAGRQFDDDLLLAEPTVMAATESLAHLRDIAAEKQLSLGNGALTIEAIVRETLKPYLKEWLDAHLPEIVERVVRKEVAHIMDRLDLK
ncbi:MAG: DUF2497 domain-containing protein [Alphaproteobacteria bacterium]|nr:DUF2497 domain-containing protein [Alphaproteobacteria bacterium]